LPYTYVVIMPVYDPSFCSTVDITLGNVSPNGAVKWQETN
jgi:hypothetical protein